MRQWLLTLKYFWIDHKIGIVGMALCTVLAVGGFGVSLWLFRPDLSGKPVAAQASEGTIIGFVGGDSRYYSTVSVFIRMRDNRYGMVSLPLNSGCHSGDRIAISEWQVNGRTRIRIRPPGCSHLPA